MSYSGTAAVYYTVHTAEEKTFFAFHPHGAVCFGFTVNGIFNSKFVSKSVSWQQSGCWGDLHPLATPLTGQGWHHHHQ